MGFSQILPISFSFGEGFRVRQIEKQDLRDASTSLK